MKAASLLFLLAVAALLAYAPSLAIPLIADDYPNLTQAQTYGAPSGLGILLRDAQFRLRATSYWAMFALWRLAGLTPWVYHAASLVLHIANTWLLFGLCLSWPRMRAAAFWAAAFFAVHEGHQEAVMWFSAINELLMFFFGMASLVCWIRAAGRPLDRTLAWPLETAGAVLFGLALLSKETAVFLLPLFLLTIDFENWRRWLLHELPQALPRLLPHAVLAALALASIAASRAYGFRFSDGSFSLHAPFWITWPRNFVRVLWIWGWAAGLGIFIFGDRRLRVAALLSLAWIGIALAPYSFLTYSTQIPSRQTYLAGAGLALLFGLAVAQWVTLQPRRGLVAAVMALMLLHNIGYLWTKKRGQFLQRAAPTEELIALARRTTGPIWVRCFPLPRIVAEEAIHLAAGRAPSTLLWSESEAAQSPGAEVFCYSAR